MTTYNILCRLDIDGNTAVVLEGPQEQLKNGIDVLDENGKSYKVLSIGTNTPIAFDNAYNRTPVLISGRFMANKLLV